MPTFTILLTAFIESLCFFGKILATVGRIIREWLRCVDFLRKTSVGKWGTHKSRLLLWEEEQSEKSLAFRRDGEQDNDRYCDDVR